MNSVSFSFVLQLLGIVTVSSGIVIAFTRGYQKSASLQKWIKIGLLCVSVLVGLVYVGLGVYAFIGVQFLGDNGGESGSAFALLALILGIPVLAIVGFFASLPGSVLYYLLYKPKPVNDLFLYGWLLSCLILSTALAVWLLAVMF